MVSIHSVHAVNNSGRCVAMLSYFERMTQENPEMYFLFWDKESGAYLTAHIDEHGLVRFSVKTRDLQGNLLHPNSSSKQLFAKALAHFDTRTKGVVGSWQAKQSESENESPFGSTNLYQFNAALADGKSECDAIFSTWTGKQAMTHGFTQYQVLNRKCTGHLHTNIAVLFTRP